AAVGPAYRLGGDEFCLLLDGGRGDDDALVLAGVAALSERGDGVDIGASFGVVAPGGDPAEALRIARERTYAPKRPGRAGQGGPARDVLLQVLAERNARSDAVAAIADAVGRCLGLDAEELDVLVRAAELHGVGTLVEADAQDRPLAGERILAVADSMR